ncbi:hypothetical protein VQ643_13385 [Pseudomonas sp. F1_0610]|uniref:bestrophin-like domain n=1 Tax=Pseudomonas sp. F1_0610 TaxID=3114284 RepID=UPI0039C360FE
MFNLDLQAISFDSSLIFIVGLLTMCGAAFFGKITLGRKFKHDAAGDDELKIVLGATLSLFGLLIGFILSIAISGYNNRINAEENEAMTIGSAFQRTALLDDVNQQYTEDVLQEYLTARIGFFKAENDTQRQAFRAQSIEIQTKLWLHVSGLAKAKPNILYNSVLDSLTNLYTAQQQTIASWRFNVPAAAWVLLIFFAVCSNYFIGYNIRGISGKNFLVLTVPFLTNIALFMIAEIDIPGEGIIHVTPVNLEDLRLIVARGGLAP